MTERKAVYMVAGILAAATVLMGLIGAATTNPGKYGAMVSSDGSGNPGTWVAMTGTGAAYSGPAPTPAGLMVSTDGSGNPGTWVAATPSTFGGGVSLSANNTWTGTQTFNSLGNTVMAVNDTLQGFNGSFVLDSNSGAFTSSNIMTLQGSGTQLRISSGRQYNFLVSAGGFVLQDGSGSYNALAIDGPTGNLTYHSILIPAVLYAASGTALVACSAALKGAMATVSDATTPTYNGTYTSGGAVTVPVICDGTTWHTH